MHALKILVGAAAALVVGATSAQTMPESPTMLGSAEPWAVGEAWSGEFSTPAEAEGAHGRSFSESSFPADQPAQPTLANEAYDGTAVGASADMSTGAHGRPFSEPGLTRAEVMAEIDLEAHNSAAESLRLNQYLGGD